MTIREFAKRAEVSERTAYRLVTSGKLPHHRPSDGAIRITEEDFRAYMEATRVPARTGPLTR